MPEAFDQTIAIQRCLDRLRAGDEAARNELIQCAARRLERLTRKMFRHGDRLRRWEQTDDVLQNASLRLYRALSAAQPATAADFFRLAAASVRRELCDMAKHYYGPQGGGAHHATAAWQRDDHHRDGEPAGVAVADDDAANLAAWAEFHAQVEQLPQEDREVFDLLWYQELSQAEAAAVLNVSERTIKRRWAAARLRLHTVLGKTL
jgi:RNA polymerase sigma factor (sigma-70 family)